VAVLFISILTPLSFPELALHAGSPWREEKAAAEAGKHQYRDIGRIAASSGHWAGDGGEDSPNAQIVWLVQERGRFAGDPWAGAEAPRKNAQVFDGWETTCRKARRAAIG